MPVRTSNAAWEGGKDGNGSVSLGSGAFEGQYSFGSRFEEGKGTNPEELIAAAHAGCFSMALALALERSGHRADKVTTTARVRIEKQDAGFAITRIDLDCEARVPGLDNDTFQQHARGAKEGCPVSKALKAVEIELEARLVS